MPVWRNDVERDAWMEKNCRVCFQPNEATKRITGEGPGCPHLARAAKNRTPKVWTRRRNAIYGETYRCDDFADKPPTGRRKSAPADTAELFDLEPVDRNLVPVEGWPDYLADKRKQKDGDHQ